MSMHQKILPLPPDDDDNQPKQPDNAALNVLRQRVTNVYGNEPDLDAEEEEITELGAHSKHQKYIQRLMNSGKNAAEIQTAWHEYYQHLSEEEKHQVWQEFYDNNSQGSRFLSPNNRPATTPSSHEPTKSDHKPRGALMGNFEPVEPVLAEEPVTVADIKGQLLKKASTKQKITPKQTLHSLLFGLGMGTLVVLILMFSFFNERFIAPFITPSRNVSDTPIIIDPLKTSAVGPDSKIIIPKINVEIPVVYDVASIDEKAVANGLLNGVVHYPTTPVPGQNGNVAIVGHSSNNIFNKGKYKFAFVLLSRLQTGDTFMLNYDGKQYIYKVFEKKVVKPTEVSVLGPNQKAATATLITCDPPGTAMNRMVVIGEQISPSPSKNIAANPGKTNAQPVIVPGNAESLFHRLFGWIYD